METVLDLYLRMAHSYLHLAQIFTLVLFVIIYFIKRSLEPKKFISVIDYIQLGIVIFFLVLILANINIYYKQSIFDDFWLIGNDKDIIKFFKGTTESMIPFWISQISVSILAFLFYLFLGLKKRRFLKRI